MRLIYLTTTSSEADFKAMHPGVETALFDRLNFQTQPDPQGIRPDDVCIAQLPYIQEHPEILDLSRSAHVIVFVDSGELPDSIRRDAETNLHLSVVEGVESMDGIIRAIDQLIQMPEKERLLFPGAYQNVMDRYAVRQIVKVFERYMQRVPETVLTYKDVPMEENVKRCAFFFGRLYDDFEREAKCLAPYKNETVIDFFASVMQQEIRGRNELILALNAKLKTLFSIIFEQRKYATFNPDGREGLIFKGVVKGVELAAKEIKSSAA